MAIVSNELSRTKWRLPDLPHVLVPRPSVDRLLDSGRGRRLTAVVGPPGSGKTTAVVGWLRRIDRPSVWLSLDDADNDPTLFWQYVIAGVEQRLGADLRDVAGTIVDSIRRNPARFVAAFVNRLVELDTPLVLALDDFHVVADEAILRSVNLLIHQAPPLLQLTVLSRSGLQALGIQRLRANGELAELRNGDLRFAEAEAVAFIESVAGGIPAAAVRRLVERTQGWAAGLRMAGMSLLASPDREEFIQRFRGTERQVADYLLHEVLDCSEPSVQDFLLRTSILDELHPALCDALTGRRDACDVLRGLEAADAFVSRADEAGHWFRYHPLLADLLRSEMRLRAQIDEADLHRRAAAWLGARGLADRQFDHLVAAGEHEQAFAVLARHATHYEDQGRDATVRRWIAAIPDAVLASQPERLLALGLAVVSSGHPNAVLRYVERAEPHLPPAEDDPRLHGFAAGLRMNAWLLVGDAAEAARLHDDFLTHADAVTPRTLIARARFILVRALVWSGDLQRARAAWQEGRTLELDEATRLVGVPAAGAHVLLAEGHLEDARGLALDTLTGAAELGNPEQLWTVGARLVLAAVHYERDELDAALAELDRVVAAARRRELEVYLFRARVLEALVHGARAHPADAFRILDECRHFRLERGIPRSWLALADAAEIRLRLAIGDRAQAARMLSRLPAGTGRELLAARVALAGGDRQSAHEVLAGTTARSVRERLEVALLQGRCASGRADERRQLDVALDLGLADRYVRVFLEEPDETRRLLRELLADRPSPDAHVLVGRLLASSDQPATGALELVESLSERERAVLQLLPTHLSTREIATKLIVSRNTVKSHLKSIYRKLGADSRSDAVSRARALHLVD